MRRQGDEDKDMEKTEAECRINTKSVMRHARIASAINMELWRPRGNRAQPSEVLDTQIDARVLELDARSVQLSSAARRVSALLYRGSSSGAVFSASCSIFTTSLIH